MGSGTITAAVGGTIIPSTDHNQLRSAMMEDFVSRNSSGVATTLSGSLGTSSIEWLKAFIASGYWNAGDIKPHHSYNGTVGPGHGWMLCDGRQITEAAYNTEHGASSWATYVVSSSLTNLYLPNLTDKFLMGAATTTETGVGAITPAGNTGNQVDISHTHAGGSHNHKYWDFVNAGSNSQTYNSGGSAVDFPNTSYDANKHVISMTDFAGVTTGLSDSWTANNSATTGSGGSATQDITPESIEVQFYMRII